MGLDIEGRAKLRPFAREPARASAKQSCELHLDETMKLSRRMLATLAEAPPGH